MRTLLLHGGDIGKGSLILVNPSHPMRHGPAEDDLMAVSPECHGIYLERQTAYSLRKVTDYLKCQHQIVPVSGYRTMQEQESLYESCLNENGQEFTRKFVAVPGCSEHQTGLAIDLGENRPNIDFIRPEFPYSGICQVFRYKSIEYGFIERYPAGKERVTHIAQEPWHFRYVGYPHSALMYEKNLTLEEYTDYLKQFSYAGNHLNFRSERGYFEIYHVPVSTWKSVSVLIPDESYFRVSGNNDDGFVVTLRGNQE